MRRFITAFSILPQKIGQLPLVRRLGIPECFLLVTQRITKYPTLVERIIQNTEGKKSSACSMFSDPPPQHQAAVLMCVTLPPADTDEHASLAQGLTLIRDVISQVNDLVDEYEKASRLREIGLRLDPKSLGRLNEGLLFSRDELIQGNKTLLHEGTVTWKNTGKQKGACVCAWGRFNHTVE